MKKIIIYVALITTALSFSQKKEIKTLEEKNKLFTAFVIHLKENEKLKKVSLYLNFESDYSLDYKSNYNTDYKIERVKTKVTSKKICNNLTVR